MAQPDGIDSPSKVSKEIEELMMEIPKDFNVIEGQWNRYYRAAEGHERWAVTAKQCVEFFEGKQWTDEELAILQGEGRPCLTLNKLSPLVRLIFGYFRQNRADIKYLPGHDGSGMQEIAEVLSATAKEISERNKSDWKEAQQFQDGIMTGRGFMDSRLDFSKNVLGDVIETVKDPFAIKIDPEAESYDPNEREGGWGYYFEDRWMSPNEIFMLYGGKATEEILTNVTASPLDHGNYGYWFTDEFAPSRYFGLDYFMDGQYDRGVYGLYASPFHHINRSRKLVRVLDCQHKILKKVNFFLDLETGHETLIPESMDRNKIARMMEWIKIKQLPITVRTAIRPRIRWTITAGDRVMFDDWSPYDRYTITPYFPYFRRGHTRGMVHDLLDPQREINRRRSAFLHIIMTTANSGWMYEEGSLEDDMQQALEEYGSRPGIHVEYKEGYEAPRKIEPSATPVAMKKLEDDANSDLKEISSVNDSALGNLDRVQSGRAIQARQRQSVMGTEMYFDNFSYTREIRGESLKAIVQRYYNEPRLIRVRGADGNMEEHSINIRTAAGEIVNNITHGQYSTVVDETPISDSFMQGQFAEAMELREAGVPVPDDVLVDLSSMPRKDEIKQRLEEEQAVRENQMLLENLGVRGQMGVPPEAPLPPIATSGQPLVQEVAQPMPQPQPMMPPPAPVAQPMPPQGAPMPPQAMPMPPVPQGINRIVAPEGALTNIGASNLGG